MTNTPRVADEDVRAKEVYEYRFQSLMPTAGTFGSPWSVFVCGNCHPVRGWDARTQQLLGAEKAEPGHGGLACFVCGSKAVRETSRYAP